MGSSLEDVVDTASVQAELVKMGGRAVPHLIDALKSSDDNVREKSAETLGLIEDKSAIPALIGALRDQEWNVRFSVAWALGNIGDESAAAPLLEALNDETGDVRFNAAKALEKIAYQNGAYGKLFFGGDLDKLKEWFKKNKGK
ncbi:MAG: HEAT repeat domain-containing protein [Sedimentisphaerales bacterium]|jgi:HEAT repeat protein